MTSEGFVVMVGSKIVLKTFDSFPESAQKNREKYKGKISSEGVY